ncbi:MAG: SDR family oxidoreductase, partial [Deltaproteobacteria bacterium]|nr:SDR family oxidoreductase [Nannocystaceae bacterium]
MSSRSTHLVTGGTGFVGAAVVLELLERTEDAVVAIVRPGDTNAPRRFREALATAAAAYASRIELASALERCAVVAGDVAQPGCGLDRASVGQVTQVWHCAASLRYENRHAAEIEATNVGGTRQVLALAEALGAEAFNYVSTAYVSGRTSGIIREQVLTDAEPNNCYERSKQAAEQLVLALRGPQVRIFRPSIVVGHSRTLAATTFSGYYGFVRQILQFRGMSQRVQAGLLETTPLRLRLDPEAPINLVPVDIVAREAVAIARAATSEGVYHLTHAAPPTVGTTVRTIFAMNGLHEPIFVGEDDELGWLDQPLDRRLVFYRSYTSGDRRFDRSRSDAALGTKRCTDPVYDVDAIDALGRWYLARLQR